jgi:hypothetical protein
MTFSVSPGSRWRAALFSAVAVSPFFGPSPVLGSEQPSKGALIVDAAPLLGDRAQVSNGWYGYLVQVENPTGTRLSGELSVRENVSYMRTDGATLLRTTFSIEAGQTAMFELPVHGYLGQQVRIELTDESGKLLGASEALHQSTGEAILLDLTQPSRIAKGFAPRGWAQPPASLFSAGVPPTVQSFAVSTPRVEKKSGQLLIPTHAAAYAAATLVLVESEALGALPDAQLHALSGWVLAGGTLAVAVTRDEDLTGKLLPRFVGAPIQSGDASKRIEPVATRVVSNDSATLGTGGTETQSRVASKELTLALADYSGGNLFPTPYGAYANYGMGEVHLLAFNPNREPFLGDPWVEFKLTDLLERALQRKTLVASPFGRLDHGDWRVQEIKRSLDPNVGNQWVIAVSALLLVLYAIGAGPINFQQAQKAHTPLKALLRLPIIAGITFAMILALGWVSKGGRSRARHLTLVEAGAGMERASAVRFRAFYGATASQLSVGPKEQGHLLDVSQYANPAERTMRVERDGLRVEGFSARPWETIVIREDGFVGLGDGIALLDMGEDIGIKNRSGRDLAGVLLRRPDGQLHFIDRVVDQAEVLASSGDLLSGGFPPTGFPASLQLSLFRTEIDKVVPGLTQALEAWGTLGDGVDFWPRGVPVLMAQWVGGEGEILDSGYAIDSDRVVLRVVGFGGSP